MRASWPDGLGTGRCFQRLIIWGRENGGRFVMSDVKSINAESRETGLWLWHGDTPPPRSPPGSLSRRRQILDRIVSVSRWTRWTVPVGISLLMVLAASLVLRSTPSEERPSAGTGAVAPQTGSLLIATHTLISPPSIELADIRLDQLKMPPTAADQTTAQPPEGPMVKQRVARRSPANSARAHASFACRGSPVLIPGVLTPPKD